MATPDLYLRDFVLDNGVEVPPHTGSVSNSPDIIVRRNEIPNSPQDAFGELSATVNLDTLSQEVLATKDNFIYVRVRNKGVDPATNVLVTVLFSTPATLVTPGSWQDVNSMIPMTPSSGVVIPTVPIGDFLTAAGPIKFQQAKIPGAGHYCFIGWATAAGDVAVDHTQVNTWQKFLDLIVKNNNFTWRNFDVIAVLPGGALPMGFNAPGADLEGAPDHFGFEIGFEKPGELPMVELDRVRIKLQAPVTLLEQMHVKFDVVGEDEEGQRGETREPLSPNGLRFEANFGSKRNNRMQLIVENPKDLQDGAVQLFARHIDGRQEVGRVTRRLVPPHFLRQEKDNEVWS